jgi:tetratricopeptide (TPR) repeat protein
VWVAYLGQMLVSIDTIGISVWIWIMSGLLLGVKLNQDPLTSNQSYLEKSTQSVKKQKKNKKFSLRSVLSLTAVAVTIVLLSPLGILDNKVWQLENALKSNNTVPVTREDLDSLYKTASNWSLDPTLMSRSSSILLSYGFQDKGFELLNRATLMNQDSPTLWNLRAAATESILNRQLAAPIRERELELDPWNQESSIQYIKDLIESRRFESAKKEFRRLEKFSPKSTIPSELKNYFEKEGN